ncbi:MAG: hypothetical protein HY276_09175 [Ignavibacteriales bacterium]|nr:hypothetical protein [Ignavibacteriales bacterium]
MAKVRKNIIIEGLSGSLGDQLVVKTGKGGQTVISTTPKFSGDRKFTDAQAAQQEKFREGSAYAKDAAKKEPLYGEKAAGTPQTAYNVAMADFMHPPEILEIDVSKYSGKAGETIRARAQDDVKVKTVNVVIATEQDQMIEQGAATPEDGSWWKYTATANAPSENVKVIVHAWDLPGHEAVKQA